MVFTAFPIMWFAMFDEEFAKSAFHNSPEHYWIGLANHYYTYKELVITVFKGMLNGLLMYLFIFMSLNGHRVASDGSAGSLWLSSSIIYAVVVINANAWIV